MTVAGRSRDESGQRSLKYFCACLGASLLAGCATVSDLRQSPPVRAGTIRGNYLALADCVMSDIERLRAEDGVRYRLLTVPAAKTASILGAMRVPAGLFYTVPAAVLELSFKQDEANRVAIETRSRFPGSALEPGVWPLVERCAGTTLTLVPPLQ